MSGLDVLSAEVLNRERAALAETLRAVGPDAPTLIRGWAAADLAAHLAATEQMGGVPTFLGRSLVARLGWRLNDAFRPVMTLDRRRFRRHGFDWAVSRLERPSPRLLTRPAVLPVSVFEIFVHHEDVRRPSTVSRQAPVPDVTPCIEWLLRYHRHRLGRFGVTVILPGGRELHGGGPETAITITGSAEDALLWLARRRDTAAVTVTDGAPDASAIAKRLIV